MFQGDDALFNWLRTIDNVAFGLRMRGVARSAGMPSRASICISCNLDGQEDKYPGEFRAA